MGEAVRAGEGEVIADLDLSLIGMRKRLMDSRGHYSRPELLSLVIDRSVAAHVRDRNEAAMAGALFSDCSQETST